MSVKFKPKIKVFKVAPREEETDYSDDVTKLEQVMDEVSDTCIDKSEEIEALALCILTQSHMMIEGLHGTAKSMIVDELFRRLEGAVTFKKMLMKTTQPDEIFGPMNSQLYREKAIWTHNIEKMLPEAHFAFLDETYRAADQLLPSLFNVLNEREFINGTDHISCPLITCVGTTNFKTENPELEAFHDRWHVWVHAQPLAASQSIIRMLQEYSDRRGEKSEINHTISLETIQRLIKGVNEITIPKDMLEVYEQLTRSYAQQMGNIYISDRRKCISLIFAKARALLGKKNEVDENDLEACRYGLIQIRNTAQESVFNSTFANTISSIASNKKENSTVRRLKKYIAELETRLETNMPKEDAENLFKEARRLRMALNKMGPDEGGISSEDGKQAIAEISTRADDLLQALQEQIS